MNDFHSWPTGSAPHSIGSARLKLPRCPEAGCGPSRIAYASFRNKLMVLRQKSTAYGLLAVLLLAELASSAAARNIQWSSYTWWVRTSQGGEQGPGPNIFSDSTQNVFVDGNGDLHLTIVKGPNNKWMAAEVDMNQSLGYGTYEWEVSSRYDQFASNTVGGLFTYLDPESVATQTGGVVGNGVADTPHEIDIEFTGAWGSANLYFTTHDPDVQSPSQNYYQGLNDNFTTHRFTWKPDSITWESYHGHVAGVAAPTNPITEERAGTRHGQAAKFVYTGPVVPQDLNEVPIINLWLSGENVSTAGPTDGQTQEMIVHSFTYTPLRNPGDFNADGEVDSLDYDFWRQEFGSTLASTADANGDGVVDAADYTIWRDNVSSGLGAVGQAISVPEHTTIVTFAFLIGTYSFFRW
jgi:Dockerin type I domain